MTSKMESPGQQAPSPASERVILVGQAGAGHVGAHLKFAAQETGTALQLIDAAEAYAGSPLHRRFNWWLRGRRPCRLDEFSHEVAEACRSSRPAVLITTGIAPVSADALDRIGREAVRRINYLTDDPWNPAHRAPWFLSALPRYDEVFSPRRANLEELRRAGCPRVSYLPFAYSEQVHLPAGQEPPEVLTPFASDVMFAGGADADRLPLVRALIRRGFSLALYGGYWERDPVTRPFARGFISPVELKFAVAAARVCLCLVRKANRDGHSMRTFELAAMKGCLLVEWTEEHQEIFGQAAAYFRSEAEMVEVASRLLDQPEERARLAETAYRRVVDGGHSYHARLKQLIAGRA